MTNTRFFEAADLVQAGGIKAGDFVGVIGTTIFGQVNLVKRGGWLVVRIWLAAEGDFIGWKPYRRGDLVGPIPADRIEDLKTRKSEYGVGRNVSLPGGIKVTADEMARIRATAKTSGLTFSAWVRSRLLEAK